MDRPARKLVSPHNPVRHLSAIDRYSGRLNCFGPALALYIDPFWGRSGKRMSVHEGIVFLGFSFLLFGLPKLVEGALQTTVKFVS